MKHTETINTSLKALSQNKIRTLLTILGVIIGVFSVVILISLMEGIQNYVTDQFDELGSNLVFVYPGSGGIFDDPALAFSNNKLAKKHCDLIEKYADNYVLGTSPIITAGKTAEYKTRKFFAVVYGVSSDYSDLTDMELVAGRHLTKNEEKSNAKVVILGDLVKKELFKEVNPIGKEIKIDGNSYTVIGVTEPKGEDFDEMVVIPYTTAEKVMDLEKYSFIAVKIDDSENVDIAMKEIELALMHDLEDDDFTLFSQNDLLETFQDILRMLSLALSAVAGISLVVGGIGIMNIMLVSVTERIKEIGLRKALGATSLNIGFQFVVESVVMSIFGGLIGLVFAYGGTLGAQKWIRAEIPIWGVGIAFGFSLLVGAVFGTYPAVKASKMDPIEALRFE